MTARDELQRRLEALRADIAYLEVALGLGTGARAPPKKQSERRGRPAGVARLCGELERLEGVRAALHSEWIVRRGGEAFSSPAAARLVAAGVWSAPALPRGARPPRARVPSRPRKRLAPAGAALRFWVDLLIAWHASHGTPITVRRALELAQPILRTRLGKPGFIAREQSYHREPRRRR